MSGDKGALGRSEERPEQVGGEKKKITIPFLTSVFLHGGLLMLLGGAVLVPGIIPKAPFVGEMVVPSAFDAPTDEPIDDFLVESPVETEMPSLEVPDLPMAGMASAEQTFDVIASTTPPPSSTFSLPVGTGVMGLAAPSMDLGRGTSTASAAFSAPTGKRSSVQFFGIRAESQRVAFLLDASGSMITEQRGGREGYARLKDELVRMVNGLDATSEFNVFIFDQDVDAFRPRAVAATDRNKQEFAQWIAPYMTDQFGNRLRNFSSKRLEGFHGQTRMDLALTGAFESGSDTIFMLTDGTPDVRRPPTDREVADWERLRERNARALAEWEAKRKEYYEKYRETIAEMEAELKRRNAATTGRTQEWEWWIDGFKGLPPRPENHAPPGAFRPTPQFTHDEIFAYLNSLYEELYRSQNMNRPTIHVVGYSVSNEDKSFLQQLARRFGGRYQDFRPGR